MDDHDMPAIHRAIERGERAHVEAILAADPTQIHAVRDAEDPDQPLHFAAWQNRIKIARILIAAGADLNARGASGWSPLQYAAQHGSLGVARVLIRAGADINQQDDHGFTPVFRAIRSREPEGKQIAQLLINAGAVIDLNAAVCLDDLGRVQAILAADPNAVQTAAFPRDLIYDAVVALDARPSDAPVSWQEKYPILALLIAHGADVNGVGFASWPPVYQAIQMGDPQITEILLQHGADLNYRPKAGPDLWDLASRSHRSTEKQALLQQYGFNR